MTSIQGSQSLWVADEIPQEVHARVQETRSNVSKLHDETNTLSAFIQLSFSTRQSLLRQVENVPGPG